MENVTKKIRVHRTNGGEVKFKHMDKFEINYRGQSRKVSEKESREPQPWCEFRTYSY